MSTHIENQSWRNYKESQSLMAYMLRCSPQRPFVQRNTSRSIPYPERMRPSSNTQRLEDVARLIGTKLRINSHVSFSGLDPDVSETTFYLTDNNILAGKAFQFGFIKVNEKNVKKKMATVQESMAKKAFQQVTTPSEDYRPRMSNRLSSMGTAAKPQLKKESQPDIEKNFCIGITSLDGLGNRDFTKSKWYVVFLSQFGLEATVEFVKKARELASEQDVDFFKMIIISNSGNASRVNEAFAGTGVIIRHYTDLPTFSDSLERLDKELAEYEI